MRKVATWVAVVATVLTAFAVGTTGAPGLAVAAAVAWFGAKPVFEAPAAAAPTEISRSSAVAPTTPR